MDNDKIQHLDFEQDLRKLVQHFRMQVGLNKSMDLGQASPRFQEG